MTASATFERGQCLHEVGFSEEMLKDGIALYLVSYGSVVAQWR